MSFMMLLAAAGAGSMMPNPGCYLFRLPSELKIEVLSYLDTKRDLYNVSKTCRWLEDIALKRLYNTIDLEIPAERSSAWSTGGYLKLRSHVIRVIREITIRDGVMDHNEPRFHRRRRSDAGCSESYAAQVVEQIPVQQLKSFSFLHRSRLSLRTLQLLGSRHGQNLRRLSCYEVQNGVKADLVLPSNLQSLECRSVDSGETLSRLIKASKDTLQSLQLGEERALVEQYYNSRTTFFEHTPQPLNAGLDFASIKNLRRLCLVGIDVMPLVPLEIESAMYLTNLEELTMESCGGNVAFLTAVTSTFTFAQSSAAPEPKQLPVLEKFLLRCESSNAALRDVLIQFLNSFSGLRMLSLLFENGSMSARLATLIPTHGETLEHLVLESRIQPRESLRIDTSRPFGMGGYTQQMWEESIDDVCRLCPNLLELSMGFPLNDEMVRLRQSPLPSLRHLKTMHIRNFPESRNLVQMGDYSIKEHATKFIEWTFGHLQGSVKPQLETLSIGPVIYESRFKGANPTRHQAPEYLRTHHFTLDWAQTRFGRWSAMITGVSEKYMEEMRNEKPLGGVFQQVWLK